eukprot:788678_1
MASNYNASVWEPQRKMDRRQYISDIRVYQFLNEKPNWLKHASDLNPFSTSCFIWVDIGSFRTNKLNGKRLVQAFPHVFDSEMLIVNIGHFQPDDLKVNSTG